MASERFYTAKEAANLYNVAESTIRKYIRNGRLSAEKHGKIWRISEFALLDTFPMSLSIPHDIPQSIPHDAHHTAHLERLKSLEDELDKVRQENERLQSESAQVRGQFEDALASIRALTEQNERLTILLTNEQAQRIKALPNPLGWIRRLFRPGVAT